MAVTSIDNIFDAISEFERRVKEDTDRKLAEIIQNYDFAVGSKECKARLMEILPEGANIIYSPYIEDPTMIYVIKKFNVLDYILEDISFKTVPESEVSDDSDNS